MSDSPSATEPDPTREIIAECKRETRIRYKSKGNTFFRARMRGINHLQVGKSKIIDSPLTIMIEWIYEQFRRLRRAWRRFISALFPRRPELPVGHRDSRLVGRIIFAGDRGDGPPIHNLHLEFWGRTFWFAWRKIAEGRTDGEGYFALRFPLRAARGVFIRSLSFEIQKTTRVYFQGDHPHFHFDLFKAIPVAKSDLIGMDYNLRTIPLDYWLYDKRAVTPRALIDDANPDSPEIYTTGREDALIEQIIPLEITKIKHLEQIDIAPDTLTIEQIQADYPVNLTCCIEKRLPGYTRGDDWFGERMMNGMNRGCFVPDATRAGHYWMRYFGVCWYDINDLYALPDIGVLFNLKDDGLPNPLEIHLTGRLSRTDHDPFRTRVFSAVDGDAWAQAKRVARVTGAVCTEVEEHFAATHLNTEQYAISAYRNLRLNPVAGLLLPHLKEVSLINHTADKMLIGGYIPTATALTHAGLQQRTRDILGLQDWRGWKPMKAISPAHTCAEAEQLFWEVLGEYVETFFRRHEDGIKRYWGKFSASPTTSSPIASLFSSPLRRRPSRAIRNSPRNASSTTASSTGSIRIFRVKPSTANSRLCPGSPAPARSMRHRPKTGRISRTLAATQSCRPPTCTAGSTSINTTTLAKCVTAAAACALATRLPESWRRRATTASRPTSPAARRCSSSRISSPAPNTVSSRATRNGTSIRFSSGCCRIGSRPSGVSVSKSTPSNHERTSDRACTHDVGTVLNHAHHPPHNRQDLRQSRALELREDIRPGARGFRKPAEAPAHEPQQWRGGDRHVAHCR
jgi:hypothetical protein